MLQCSSSGGPIKVPCNRFNFTMNFRSRCCKIWQRAAPIQATGMTTSSKKMMRSAIGRSAIGTCLSLARKAQKMMTLRASHKTVSRRAPLFQPRPIKRWYDNASVTNVSCHGIHSDEDALLQDAHTICWLSNCSAQSPGPVDRLQRNDYAQALLQRGGTR